MQPWREDLYRGLESWKGARHSSDGDDNTQKLIVELLNRIEDNTTKIVVFGMMKAGKSTFINAFLGEKLVQDGVIETTAVVTMLTFGPSFRITAVSKDGFKREIDRQEFVGLSTEVDGPLKEERLRLDHIIIETPNRLLEGITLVDTPGYGAKFHHHTEMSDNYIRFGDFSIWVFLTNHVGQGTEVDKIIEINEVRGQLVHGVVNAIDRLNLEEQSVDDYIDWEYRTLQREVSSLIPVSSRDALESKITNDQEKFNGSRWAQVEELLSSLRLPEHEKNEKIFAELSKVLAIIQRDFDAQRKKTPIHFYAHVMDLALQEQIPSLVSDYRDILSKRSEIETEIQSLYKFMATPIDSEEALHIHNAFIEQLNEHYALSEPIKPFRETAYQNLVRQVGNLNEFVQRLTKDRDEISKLWSEHTDRIFRKAYLENLLQKQQSYNQALRNAADTWDNVQREIHGLRGRLQSHFSELKRAVLQIYSNLLEELIALDFSWDEKWTAQNRNFDKMPDDKVDQLRDSLSLMEEYSTSIGLFFRNGYKELENLHNYQQARYQNEAIINSAVELPIWQYTEKKRMVMDLRILPDIAAIDLKEAAFEFQSLLNLPVERLPECVDYPIEKEIQNIIRYRKRLTTGLVAIAVVIVLLNIDLPQLFDREQKEYSTLESKSGFEDYGSPDLVSYEEPEEWETDFTAWKEEQVMRFMHDLHYKLQTNDGELVSGFTSDGWQIFRPIYESIEHFTQSGFQQITIEQASADELVFSVNEHFTVSSEPLEFNNRYTLHYSDEPIIAGFYSAPVEQVIAIDESDLERFMVGYRDAYMEALNGNEFGFVSPYLQIGSAAFQEIKDYIQEMSTSGAYFDFISTTVDRMERTGPTSYAVQTTEAFIYEDQAGSKTKYEKTKEYTVRLLSNDGFEIEFIQSLATEKEKIVEVKEEIIMPVHDELLSSFVTDYYTELVNAINAKDRSLVGSYTFDNGTVMDEVGRLIDSVDPLMDTSLQQFDVEWISEIDATTYTVDVYVHFEYEVDGEFFAEEKYNQRLLVSVGAAGGLLIEDIIWTDYIEE